MGRIRRIAEHPAPPGFRAFVGVREGPGRFEQRVVVKVAHSTDTDAVASLAREARAHARLDHPAIPHVYDLYEEGDETVLVLQWSESTTLASLLEDLGKRGARLDVDAASEVALQLFSALDAAHTARDLVTREFAPIVHQSVNPDAIRLLPEGRLRLGEFGASRTLAALDLTPAGLLGAHEGYLAPEQVRGDRPSVRTDIYSACLVLRELLLGVPAFPRNDDYLRWLERIAQPTLPDVTAFRADLPPSLVWLLRVGLRPERDARSVTAAIAMEVLAPFASRNALIEALHQRGSIYDDDCPTATMEHARPALVARTPVSMALTSRPTAPSLRRVRVGRSRVEWLVSIAAALAATAASAALLCRRGEALPPVVAAPAAPVVSSAKPLADAAPSHVAEVSPDPIGSTIATDDELRRVVGAGAFSRCFSGDDRPSTGSALRARCRGAPTLTLLVVSVGGKPSQRIGAFTRASFDGARSFRPDPDALLFSLDPYKIYVNRVPALAVDNRNGAFGPTFGGGHDLHVAPDLSHGFIVPKTFLTRADGAFAGGFGTFRVVKLEVFVQKSARTTGNDGSIQ